MKTKKRSYCNITSKTVKVSFSVVEQQEHKSFGDFSLVYDGYPWPKYQLKRSVEFDEVHSSEG